MFNPVALNEPKQYNCFLIWYLLYVTDHMTYQGYITSQLFSQNQGMPPILKNHQKGPLEIPENYL